MNGVARASHDAYTAAFFLEEPPIDALCAWRTVYLQAV